MLKVSNVNVYGLEESIVASGYPMLDKPYTESEFVSEVYDEMTRDTNHNKRMVKLANTPTASGHDQATTGIIVQFDLEFPIKAWTELQRYHFIDFVSSMSTMHRLKSFNLDEAYDEHVDKRIIEIMKELQSEYNDNPTPENFHKLVMSNPNGMNITARMTTNYRQLKTIYHQRKNHRLFVWREFCEWVETLPYAKEFIVGGE